jgi:DNA-binding CsgD family transcriptional regulator
LTTRPFPADHDQAHAASPDQLVGRDGERGLIRRFLERALFDGGALFLRGDPGTGKTALLQAAAAEAREYGVRVLLAIGAEFESDIAFAGLHQALDPLFGEFTALGSAHELALRAALGFDEGIRQDQLIVANATLTLLRHAAAGHGVLLVVDDIHWLDRSSATILGFVARRVSGSRVALLGATRSGEGSFFDRAELPDVELLPLSDESSRFLLDKQFPTLTASVRRRVLEEAQGNPLALLELPAALERSGLPSAGGPPGVLPLSRRLQGLFASRIAALPTATRRQLLLAALDRSGSLKLLHAGSDHALDDLMDAQVAGLVWVDPDHPRVAFRHPLIRSAVVELATNAERREAHKELARLLGDQPDREAWHLGAATLGRDESVAQLLEEAARRILRRGDAVGAIAFLTRASELSPAAPDQARRLSEAAYVAADIAGEIRDLPRMLDAARQADPNVGGSLETAVAAHFALLNGDGDVDTAHRLLVGAIQEHSAVDATLEDALRILIRLCYFGGRDDLWRPFYDALARFGTAVPTDLRLSGGTLSDPARSAAGVLPDLDAAIATLPGETDPLRIDRISAAAAHVDRLDGCREALWRVVADGRRGGAVASAMGALILLARDGLLTGRWDEAELLTEELIDLSYTHDYRIRVWHGRSLQAMIAAGRGQFAHANALADEILRWATPRRVRSLQCCAWQAKALAAAGSGDFEEAFRQASNVSPAGTLASHVPHALWSILDVVEAAVRTGRMAEAFAHVQAARDADLPALSPRLTLVTLGAAGIAGTDADWILLFEQALGTPGIDRWPFDLARVQLAFGERLRRSQAMRESRLHLAAALDSFEQLGAEPWAERARGELRSTGRSKPRGEHRDPDLLTPKEREIAMLAAAGLTNKQIGERLFVSHRTVGFHLHRVFPKLGVSSRAALRDALAAQPPSREPGSDPDPRDSV